jgi:signal transduction histidine kinase
MRPRLIWFIATLCALVVLGAMGLLTRHILRLESERQVAQADAELGERLRLALWRMDSEASATLILENNRPPSQFRAFYAPTNTWSNDLTNLSNGEILQASPLLTETPDYAVIHFELDNEGLRSPQSPQGTAFNLALNQGMTPERLADGRAKWERLRVLLQEKPDLDPSLSNNRDYLLSLNIPYQPSIPDQALNASNDIYQEKLPEEAQTAFLKDAPTQQSQSVYNDNEFQKRSEVVFRNTRLGEIAKGNFEKSQSDSSPSKAAVKAEPSPKQEVKAAAPSQAAAPQSGSGPADDKPSTSTLMRGEAVASPYRALWIAGELFLIRTLEDGQGRHLQGIWLQHQTLAQNLLLAIEDLLPNASLLPRQETDAASPLSLVSLPWVLNPGPTIAYTLDQWTPLLLLLLVAWIASILALLAGGILLRGVLSLSERRATFVSSVTHELRTPLTTFRLYAEMLAGGMIKDPAKQQSYASTLKTEATRLSHLVENVLAYSRVERGSARARIEEITLHNLWDRLAPRLRERAAQSDLDLVIDSPDQWRDCRLHTDLTAVEQILFNLVDNAGKYAAPTSQPRELRISVIVVPGTLTISIRDFGPGIDPQETRRLFQPFHKSARDAAHSQPGVGLGLALSRRLARALGGDLRLENQNPGCLFHLSLPFKE